MSSDTGVTESPLGTGVTRTELAHKTTERDSTPRNEKERKAKDWTSQQRTDFSAEITKWRRMKRFMTSEQAAATLAAIYNRYPITAIERSVFMEKEYARFGDAKLKAETERIYRETH